MPGANYKVLKIEEIVETVKGVKLFYFDAAGSCNISYKAGQYLTFVWDAGPAEVRRSYSIISAPGRQERLAIGVKRIDNGLISRRLFDNAKVSDLLLTLGAGGLFILPDDIATYKQVFFFAAGSGIIPVYSLIKAALFQYSGLQVVLIYSNHSLASTLFYKELTALSACYPDHFNIEFIFSTTADLFKAHLHAGLIEIFLHTYLVSHPQEALYYTCGPEAYMRLCTYTLQEAGVPADHIKKEIFYVARRVIKNEPPDKGPHTVQIIINSEQYSVIVKYPDSILQAAKNKGVVLPYSCETGRCGNCQAKCINGKIWMSYNEVLTENELAQGYILTCTGYPVEGEATIEILV